MDSKSFVTAIGFDKGENYQLRLTFVFTTPSKNGTESGRGEKDETIVIEAPSLYSAIEQINNFKSKSIVLTHTQTIIFSEELAREGLEEYIYMLVRSSHFRPNTYVCIADNSSMDFLEKINPVQTYHLEKYFQLIFNKMTSGTRGDLYLYDLYFRLLSESNTGVLPYCAINELTLKTDTVPSENSSEIPSEEPSESETLQGEFAANTDDFAINTIAGSTISKSDNSAEIQGTAVLKNGKLVYILGTNETSALQMITQSMPNTYVTLSNPHDPDKMITCYIVPTKNTEIKVDCTQNPKISVHVDLEGDFTEVGKDDYYIKNPKIFEEHFQEQVEFIVSKFLFKIRDTNCDICGFSEVAKAQFLTVDDWLDYNWSEQFPYAEFSVDVTLTVRTYGELSQNTGRSW